VRVHGMVVVTAGLPMKLICALGLVQAFVWAEDAAPTQIPLITPLERLARQTHVASIRASASASDARSAADEMDARLAAEASARSRRESEVAASEISERTMTIRGAALEAAREEAGTAAALGQSGMALAAAKAGVKQAEASATQHIRKAVEDDLAGLYMGLQDWKMKVLHDPVKEATVAGMKAALPYERALQTIEKRVSDYESRAVGLSNQARGLRTVAKGLANGAVAKQAGGALVAASADMMNAHIMMNQATDFEAQGLRLMKDAQVWNVQIPTYVGAASAAAHKTTWMYAKNLYAPPPVGGYAAAPPVPVFLQKVKV